MKLSWKILVAATAAVLLTAVACLATVYITAKSNRVTSVKTEMIGILAQADDVMASMDSMHRSNVFDNKRLLEDAKQLSGNRPLKEVYKETSLYSIIPVVAAWKSVAAMAERKGFEFIVVSSPDSVARNVSNRDDTGAYQSIFDTFNRDDRVYAEVDEETNELVAARSVHLRESCLSCHGDPSNSLSGDGKDILGFDMEGMSVGDIKGAFVLRSKLGDDGVVAATMTKATFVSILVLLFVISGFYFFNERYISRPIQGAIGKLEETTELTNRASSEISSSSETLANGASEQAASIEETVSSLESMAFMTKSNSDATLDAKTRTQTARQAVEHGQDSVSKMIQTMNTIKDSSDNISEILKTIDEIAFQTNILALNAAVEAARAGEAGAGFAVVADEVRNLAQRSATAARETAQKVEESISNSEMGVDVSQTVSESLNGILQAVENVDDIMGTIAKSSGEQTIGIEQINLAMGEMSQVTQVNAANAEETAAASRELSERGSELEHLIGGLKGLIDGGSLVNTHRTSSMMEVPSSESKNTSKPFAFQDRSGGNESFSNWDN